MLRPRSCGFRWFISRDDELRVYRSIKPQGIGGVKSDGVFPTKMIIKKPSGGYRTEDKYGG